MKILVAFESRGGRTKRAAEAIAEAARKEGHTVAIQALGQLRREDLMDQDLLFLGTWVEGYILFGVGPASAALRSIEAFPSLEAKPVAIFCTYAFHPRGTLGALRSSVESKGARVIGERAFHRRQPEQGADGFVRDVLGAVASS